jgi:phage gp46-like protein
MDIALKFTDKGDFDIVVENGDILGDPGLATPVTVSLYTDRVARVDDPLPEFQPGIKSDRRGWWGDLTRANGRRDPIGSRLWLLSREKELPSVVARANEYAQECLTWLRDESGQVAVAATDEGRGRLKIAIEASAPGLNVGDPTRWVAVLDIREPSRMNFMGAY